MLKNKERNNISYFLPVVFIYDGHSIQFSVQEHQQKELRALQC